MVELFAFLHDSPAAGTMAMPLNMMPVHEILEVAAWFGLHATR